jgi:hypothetical protein
MKIILYCLCFVCMMDVHAQRTKIMGFPITDYIVESDSVTVLQVKLPQGLQIKEKSYCLLKSVYKNLAEPVIRIGNGRCQLIKGEYYYFGFMNKDLTRKPVAGDILYSDVMTPSNYEGLLFRVMKHSITLNSVDEKLIADINTVIQMKDTAAEQPIIEQLAADVRYTGTEMPKLSPAQDITIESGRFKGKKIFAAMQAVTSKDVTGFLEYIRDYPDNYAGLTWKFSEIMATWISEGAPPGVK